MRQTRTFSDVTDPDEVYEVLYESLHGPGPGYTKVAIEPQRLVFTKQHPPANKDKIVVNFIAPQPAHKLAELFGGLPVFMPHKAKLHELLVKYQKKLVVRKDANTLKANATLSR